MRQLQKLVVLAAFILVASGVAWAAKITHYAGGPTATANEIATAIQASSATPDFMKQNAVAWVALVTNLESKAVKGQSAYLDEYNGSCCAGIWQMNNGNRKKFSTCGGSESCFARQSLSEQTDAYGQLMAEDLASKPAKWMMSHMGQQFGPRTIDAAMVAACVQLGIGYCQDAIHAGTCAAVGDGSASLCDFAKFADMPTACNDTSVCTQNGAGSSGGLATDPGAASSPGTGVAGGTGGTGTGTGTGTGGLAGTDFPGVGSSGGLSGGGIGTATFAAVPELPRSQGSKEIPILEGTGD